jgi:hypothetical protein
VIGQGTSASLLDRKPRRRPRKTIPEQALLILTKTLVVEIPFAQLQLDLPLFLEKTLEQDKPVKIPDNQPIITDNTIILPKPNLGKQLIVEEDLGVIDIDMDNLIYPPYSP